VGLLTTRSVPPIEHGYVSFFPVHAGTAAASGKALISIHAATRAATAISRGLMLLIVGNE
jgi:hypothetical protein